MTDRAEKQHRKDMYARGWADGMRMARWLLTSDPTTAVEAIDRLLAEHRDAPNRRWK